MGANTTYIATGPEVDPITVVPRICIVVQKKIYVLNLDWYKEEYVPTV